MNQYYIMLLIAYILESFAGIPLLYNVYKTQDTSVIPYLTLIMTLTSAIILLYISFISDYYLHSFVFLIYFVIYGLLLLYKYSNETGNLNIFKQG